jgi:hypothetical protein
LKGLPDLVWWVLSREPSPIPSPLPGIDPGLRDTPYIILPPLPNEPHNHRRFLQEERYHRPRDLLYRFLACDGFVICGPSYIKKFLDEFEYRTVCSFVPFLRPCIKVVIHINMGGIDVKIKWELEQQNLKLPLYDVGGSQKVQQINGNGDIALGNTDGDNIDWNGKWTKCQQYSVLYNKLLSDLSKGFHPEAFISLFYEMKESMFNLYCCVDLI